MKSIIDGKDKMSIRVIKEKLRKYESESSKNKEDVTCIVIGGGYAGCAAAITAKKQGAKVCLIEKTDLLVGLGNVGGIMRNNGRFTATEENIALGAGEIFKITDNCSLHKNVDFPGHKHASFYDVSEVEPKVTRLLKELDIEVRLEERAVDVIKRDKGIKAVKLADGEIIEGDVFIDATGTTGPMGSCMSHGNGCSMCVLRCPAFGPRVSISGKAGVEDLVGQRSDGNFGAFSGSCKLEKRSLSLEIQEELFSKGYAVVPLPENMIKKEKLEMKVCKQYALDSFAKNIILIDTGYAKLMTPFFNLKELRSVKGFENARFCDPYAGGKGNSIRYMAVAPRDEYMKVKGVDNLYCGGEKSGFFVGHTEAITTGSLAGYNAVRSVLGKELLNLPRELAVGELLASGNELIEEKDGNKRRLTFAGGEFFEKMKSRGLYTTDVDILKKRIENFGLSNVYDKKS